MRRGGGGSLIRGGATHREQANGELENKMWSDKSKHSGRTKMQIRPTELNTRGLGEGRGVSQV